MSKKPLQKLGTPTGNLFESDMHCIFKSFVAVINYYFLEKCSFKKYVKLIIIYLFLWDFANMFLNPIEYNYRGFFEEEN